MNPPSDLRKVERAAVKSAAARSHLELSIREAHAKGDSLRALARAAGMSHESVRKIVAR